MRPDTDSTIRIIDGVRKVPPCRLTLGARGLLEVGLCVLPADRLRKYTTLPTWKGFQTRCPTKEEVDRWFTAQIEAMCLVCGAVSGNLEVIDFDAGGEAYEAWRKLVEEHAPGLLDRLVIERTPSGGYHVWYRCETAVSGNTVLAKRRIDVDGPGEYEYKGKRYTARQDSSGQWYYEVILIETRGEGGLCLCAPSPGYQLLHGEFTALPTITEDERDILLVCARELNEAPPQIVDGPRPATSPRPGDLRPGDDFNARGDIHDHLIRHGWTLVRHGENQHWCRPGKTGGVSATLKDGVFYVFSSNAAPFEPNKAYSRFAVYTLLERGGNYSAAASALHSLGFGTRNASRVLHRNGTSPSSNVSPPGNPDCPEESERPMVLLCSDEHLVIDEAIEALRSAENLYHRGCKLVRVVREAGHRQRRSREKKDLHRPEGSAFIQLLPAESLRELLTRHSLLSKTNAKGEMVPAHPTSWLVNGILARAVWPGLRSLSGISHAPVLRPDGTIHQEPGYDPETGVLFLPEPGIEFPNIHPEVCIEDAEIARDELLEVVCDFPIASNAHKSVWLASVLTPLARHAFEGCAPLTLVDSNIRGSGKTLLVQAASLIALGRPVSVSAYAHDQVELQKRITAIAIAGEPVVLLDNLSGTFGNGTLDRALTSLRWQDRILGRNENVDLPLHTVWFATGNNVEVAADTSRRLVHIRLDCLSESPEERSGFRHPDLLQWVGENRPRLVAGALTILRAYFNAGCPRRDVPAFGSFEGWSGLVRQAVIWVGLPDPCTTRTALAQTSDSVVGNLRDFIAAWTTYDPHQPGTTAAELLGRLYPPQREQVQMDDASVEMRAALESFVACHPGKQPTARLLGRHLTVARRRVVDGRYIDMVANTPKGSAKRWKVVECGSETDCHDSPDSVSIPSREKVEVKSENK